MFSASSAAFACMHAKDPRQGNPCSGANKTPSSLLTAGYPGRDFLSDAGFLNLENFQPLVRFKVRKIAVLAGHAPKS